MMKNDDIQRISDLIDWKSKSSIRLSNLLSDKISLRSSFEIYKKGIEIKNNPFPRDSEIILDYRNINTNAHLLMKIKQFMKKWV